MGLGFLVLWLLGGCSMLDHSLDVGQETSILSLWQVYVRCRATQDPDSLWVESARLREAARFMHALHPRGDWPEAVESILSNMPARWSVDTDAMAED